MLNQAVLPTGVDGDFVVAVHGHPAPQGSKKVYNGRLIESSKKVGPWRKDVVEAALKALEAHRGVVVIELDEANSAEGDIEAHPETVTPLFLTPVEVDLTFVLPRPMGHYRTGRNAGTLRGTAPAFPATKPDSDKLARAALDALTLAGVFRDDAQVTDLRVRKRYLGSPDSPLPTPGVHIVVRALSTSLDALAALSIPAPAQPVEV